MQIKSKSVWGKGITCGLIYFNSMLLAGPAISDDKSINQGIAPDMALALAKFGGTMVVGSKDLLPSSTITPADANTLGRDLTDLSRRYQNNVNQARYASDLTRSIGDVIITSTELGAISSGVGAPMATVLASAARYGNEQFANLVAQQGKDKATAILSSGLQTMSSKDRKKFDEFLANDQYKNAADLFDSKTAKLSKLESTLQSNPNYDDGVKVARALIIETIKEGTSASLIMSGKALSRAKNIETSLANHITIFGNFSKDLSSRIDELTDKSNDLKKSVNEVRADLTKLSDTQNQTSLQIAITQEVIFNQQSPSTKLAMLNAGAMPGLDDQQKTILTDYLNLEIKKQKILDTANSIVTISSDINTILTNLKIQAPDGLNIAIQYGSITNSALSQAFSGNYLGAIGTISGLFSGAKQDPTQQQFQRIFVELSRINEKLDAIIETQKSTLLAIEELSKQLSGVERRIHERLDNIEFEVNTIKDATLIDLWRDMQPCMSAEGYSSQYQFNSDSLRFDSAPSIWKFVSERNGTIFPCAYALRGMFSHLRNTEVFGNPIRLEFAKSELPDVPDPEKNRVYSRTNAEYFLTKLHKPSYELLALNWTSISSKKNSGWGSFANAFVLLATPSDTVSELLSRVNRLNRLDSSTRLTGCGKNSLLSNRSKSLLCVDNSVDYDENLHSNNEAVAAKRTGSFLKQAIIRDQMANIVSWSALVANAADFAEGGGESPKPLNLKELINSKNIPIKAHGLEIIEGALMVNDVSIAQQSMIYGDLTAYFIFKELWDEKNKRFFNINNDSPTSRKIAKDLLSNNNNPWLQRNVAMLIMDASERLCKGAKCTASDLKYRIALSPFYALYSPPIAEAEKPAAQASFATATPEMRAALKEILLSIFELSEETVFEERDTSPNNQPVPRRIVMKLDGYELQIPTANDWAIKKLSYPPGMIARLKDRTKLSNIHADYTMFHGVDPVMSIRLVNSTSTGIR